MRKLRIAVAALAATLVTFVGAAPARAAYNDCPNDYFCAWGAYGGTGTRYQWAESTIAHGVEFSASGPDNSTSSWYNRTDQAMRLFFGHNCTGSYKQMSIDQYATGEGSDWNNAFSSAQGILFAGTGC